MISKKVLNYLIILKLNQLNSIKTVKGQYLNMKKHIKSFFVYLATLS